MEKEEKTTTKDKHLFHRSLVFLKSTPQFSCYRVFFFCTYHLHTVSNQVPKRKKKKKSGA